MTRRMGWYLVIAALAVAPVQAIAADTEPTLTLRVRPLSSILEDAKYVAGLIGQADTFQLVEGQLGQVTGIDLKKPLGAYATLSPGIVDSSFAILLPVTGEKDFLNLLGVLGQNPDRDNDGIYTVNVPQVPFPVYFRFANAYVYLTVRDKEALGKDKLLAPAKVFPAGQDELLGLSLRIDKIPNELRQLVTSQIELRLPDLLDQKDPAETEAQRKLRTAAVKEVATLATSILQECKELRFHFDLDRKTHSTSLQLSLDGVSKSGLAASISSLGKTTSPVAGLMRGDAAVNGGFNVALPENMTKALWAVIEEGARKDLDTNPNPVAKAMGMKLLKAIEPTFKAGKFQSAAALRGPAASGRFTLVGGSALQNGKNLEQTLREILKEMPAELRNQVALDDTKVGTISVHKFTPPQGSLDANALKLFGDGPFFAALTADAAFVALGENALDALKQALTLKPGPVPVFNLEMAVARLALLNDGPDANKALAAAKKVFQGADKDNDRVRISLEGGDALKLRMEARTALLKFFYEVSQNP